MKNPCVENGQEKRNKAFDPLCRECEARVAYVEFIETGDEPEDPVFAGCATERPARRELTPRDRDALLRDGFLRKRKPEKSTGDEMWSMAGDMDGFLLKKKTDNRWEVGVKELINALLDMEMCRRNREIVASSTVDVLEVWRRCGWYDLRVFTESMVLISVKFTLTPRGRTVLDAVRDFCCTSAVDGIARVRMCDSPGLLGLALAYELEAGNRRSLVGVMKSRIRALAGERAVEVFSA